MANATSTQLQELYVAYFGRAADPTGLDYWTEKGITTSKFAADMYAQAEFKDAYGSLSTESQVNQIYQNLFDRDADATGLLYWTKQIDLGVLQLAEIATHLIWAAQNNSGSEDDKTALTNKTNAAIAYTNKVKESTSAILAYQAESTDPWKSGVNIAEAVSYMSGINKDTASTTAGIASSVTTITNNGVPSLALNYSLTSGVDDIDGTSGVNKINAGLTSSGGNTLNSLDEIDGGAGTDTLNASVATSVTPGEIKNVETINVTFEAAAKTFNATNVSGVTTLTDIGSTGAGTVSNIGDTSTNLKVSDNTVGATFTYKASAVTGTADSVNLELANATGGNGISTVITGAIETLNLTSSTSANSVRLDTVATTLNISGSADLTLGVDSTALNTTTTIDASAATGDITFAHDHTTALQAVTITGGSGNDTLTLTGTRQVLGDTLNGGAGDDRLIFSHASDLTNDDIIDGGAGTDTLVGDDGELVALTTANNISNIEVIESASSLASGTITLANIDSSIKSVTLAAGAAAGTVTFGAGTNTLTLGTASAGALVVNDTGLATTDVLNIATSATADSGNGQAVTVNGFETVNLNSSTATAKTFGAIAINGDPDSAGVNTSATLDIAGAANVQAAVITVGSATTGTGTIDASDLTGNFVQTAAAVGATTITGGSGDDTIRGEGLASTLTGGAGNDAIVGGTAADTISGGAGNDTLTLTNAATAAAKDTITGGAGNDIFYSTDANLDAAHVLNGGDGTDTLKIDDLSAITDAQLENNTSIELLTSDATGLNATLDSFAQAMGLTTITLAGTHTAGVADTVTIQNDVTNAITVNVDVGDYVNAGGADGNTVNAATYTGVLTVKTLAAGALDGGELGDATITGGTGTSDTLSYHGATLSTTELASISAIENFVQVDDVSASLTLHNNNTADGKSLTVDGRAIINTSNTFAVNASAEADGSVTIHGATGVDTITATVSDLGDTISTYAGADTINIAGAQLTILDTIDGGAGSDTLSISASATLADVDFTNVTNIEALTFAAASSNTDLGAQYVESGSSTITLTTGTNDLNLDNVTTAQTLNLVAGTDTIDASSMTAALTVKYAVSNDLNSSEDTITAGTSTSDVLELTYSGAAAALDGVSGFETIKGATDAAQTITTVDANVASTKSLTIDMTANTSTTATVDISAETNGAITILGGSSANTVTLSVSSMGDTFTGGAGTDGVSVQDDQLTSADTINGVSGTDTLTIVGNGTIADGDFTNVTNFDTLVLGTGGANTFVLGAEFQEAGFTAVTDSGAVNSTITIGSGVTSDQTITVATGDDTITASASSAAMTFDVAQDSITSADTLTGGSGSSDKLLITFGGTALDATDLGSVTGIEIIEAKTDANGAVTLADANAVSSVLTIDVDAITTSTNTFTLDATAEDDGTINYIGSAGVDTVTGAATTATGDTISTGAANDVITGGGGGDTITGGAGADTFTYTAASHSTGSARDTITDFTSGTDLFAITIDESTNTNGLTIDATVQTARAGSANVAANLSGSIGQAIYDTTNSRLIVNATADNLITTLDYQIDVNAASTAASTIAAGDINYTVTTGSGADTIVTGAGVDTINSGAGADTINSGAGADTIDLTVDATNDVIRLQSNEIGTATQAQGSVDVDVVSNFLVGANKDQIEISVSAIEAIGGISDLVAVGNAAVSIAASTTSVVMDGGTNANDGATVATATILQIEDATAITESAIETALETGGEGALTMNGALAITDGYLVMADDGTDSAIFVVSNNAVVANNALALANGLTATKLLTISGLSDVDDFLATNLDFIA